MGDGSISKFPKIARDIDYLISHFPPQKLQKGLRDKEILAELSEKL